jgi:glycosyltransferase involved in cell wall biosynthesis
MNIVISTVQVPFVFGGAEIHARSLQDALVHAGHRVEIVTVPFKWYPPERMLDAMLACRLVDLTEANGRKIDAVIGLKFPAYLIPHPNKVLWILHQHRQAYELYDGHSLSDMIYYGNGREVRDAIRRADTALIPEARAVFANSANVSRRLKQYCGLESTPLYHPPGNPQLFRCEPAQNYFFFPSRINAAKRQHLAIEALALTPGDSRLIFCGESEDATYYEGLQYLVEHHGLRSRVEFLGRVSEKEKVELYANCLGVIYPPVDEDYGYVTLEAMLASKPVLTCQDSGGPLEFVTNWETGVVIAPLAEDLADAMRRLAQDATLAAELGQAGRQAYLAKDVTWDRVVETLLAPVSAGVGSIGSVGSDVPS